MDVRVRHIVTVLSVFALATLAVTQTASATGTNELGLWSSAYTAAQSDCASFVSDTNNFCWTQGGDYGSSPGVELGAKFTSAQTMTITGVRVYRVSPGTVTGHLWDGAGGPPLATGTFAGTDTHSWQDLMFITPVLIQAGHTYVASYHVSDAQYAFQYDYFSTSGSTVGPITELSSPDSSGNGVYCYDNSDPTNCAVFPVNTYRDTNYWVTPLWGYNFSGFFQPVDNAPMVNVAKAGSAIPVKFSLGGNQGLGIFQTGYPKVTTVNCSTNAPTDVIETTVTAGGSSLQYDPTADQYSYVWKTASNSAGTCAQFDLGLNDGSTHTFLVQFKK
jgi:hypothetical protein